MADNSQIQGLPPGAELRPLGSATASAGADVSQIQGLPPGAELRPVGSASLTPEQQAAHNLGPDAAAKFGARIDAAAPAQAAQGVAEGVGDTIRPITHPLDTLAGVAKTVWDASPAGGLTNAIQETLPVLHAYEDARSKGASIADALKASDNAAKQIFTNKGAIEQAVQAFHAHPTRTTARAITDAAGLLGTMYLGAPGEAAAPEEAAAPAASPLRVNPFEAKIQAAKAKIAAAANVPEGTEAAAARAPAQRISIENLPTSAPAQRISIEPPTTRTVAVPPEPGRLILSPEEAAAREQVQSVAAQRAKEQGMLSAANMPRMGSVEGVPGTGTAEGTAAGEHTTVTEPGKVVPGKEFMTGYGDNPQITPTPGRVVPGKEFMTTYADNPKLKELPPTEGVALENLIRPNVKEGKLSGANVDWNKTLADFDNLGSDAQKARFANPSAIQAALRRQATIQSIKNIIKWGGVGLGGTSIGDTLYDWVKSHLAS